MTALSPWIEKHASLIPACAPVLDVACGTGRHSLFLAARGHRVVGVDIDREALSGLAVRRGILPLVADLERGGWPFRRGAFAAVIVVNYLWRPLFPVLLAALEPGGVLLYDTFMQGNERYGRPRNPDFLLAPGELRAVFSGALEIIDYAEGEFNRPRPACRQMIAARRPA